MTKSIYELQATVCTPELVGELATLYKHARPTAPSAARFRWLYLQNPAGPAVAHLVRTHSGRLIAMSVAVPHVCLLNDRRLIAWNTVDFSVAPEHRTLGIALRLRRAVLAEADRRQVALVFAYPESRTLFLHRRSGMRHSLANQRFVLPVSYRAWLARRWPAPIGRPLGIVSGAVADALVDEPASPPRLRVRPVGWDELAQALRSLPDATTATCRFDTSEAFIMWRFAQCPRYQHIALLCELDDRPLGALVIALLNGTAWIKLLAPVPLPYAALKALVRGTTRTLRPRNIRTLSAILPRGHVLGGLLSRCGFWQASTSSTTIWRAHPALSAHPFDPRHWNRLVSDRDL